MTASPDLLEYYRAHEYERVYAKPERQADLARLHGLVTDWARGRTVLEVAWGTGGARIGVHEMQYYWYATYDTGNSA